MAKYTKKRSRTSRRRRGAYKKRRNTIKGVSRKLDKLYSAIEVKHYERVNSGVQVTNSGFVLGITGPALGDTDQLREGDKITTTSIQLRMHLEQRHPRWNNMRVVVVKIRGSSSDFAITASNMRDRIFQTPGLTPTNPFLWMYNVDYFRSSGAKILYDSCHRLQSQKIVNHAPITQQGDVQNQGGWGDGVLKSIFIKKKFLHRQNIQFTAGGANHNHQVLLLAWSETNDPLTAPALSYSTRLNYIDL